MNNAIKKSEKRVKIRVAERILTLLQGKRSPMGLEYSIHMVHNYLYGRNKTEDENIRLAHFKIIQEENPKQEVKKLLDKAEELLTSLQ